jgi:hypothetical protein
VKPEAAKNGDITTVKIPLTVSNLFVGGGFLFLVAVLSFGFVADAQTPRADTERLLREVDKRYEQRFKEQDEALKAQQAALLAAIAAQEKMVSIALAAADRAVTKAEIAAEKRFDSVNEFRGQLRDQNATFLTRAEADQRFIALSDKVISLTARIDKAEGLGSGLSAGWGYLVGAIGMVIAVAMYFKSPLK